MRHPKITIVGKGFAIATGHGMDTVAFDAIETITAYKVDELTSDLICCDIVTENGGQIRTIHEDVPGFETLMTRLAELPGFSRDWREKTVRPAFAENRNIIYRR